ncbi:MAG: hypothetical protein ABF289_01680 [Clostridiales bacterium]
MSLNDKKGIKNYFILLSMKICIAVIVKLINKEELTNIVSFLVASNYFFTGIPMANYISRILKITNKRATVICAPIMFLETYILLSIIFGFNVTFEYIKNL